MKRLKTEIAELEQKITAKRAKLAQQSANLRSKVHATLTSPYFLGGVFLAGFLLSYWRKGKSKNKVVAKKAEVKTEAEIVPAPESNLLPPQKNKASTVVGGLLTELSFWLTLVKAINRFL